MRRGYTFPGAMKILFLPFSIVAGLIAGLVGKQAFNAIWGLIDDEEPPDSEHREISMVRKLVDHQARKAFAGTFGAWPGEERPEAE
jgi:hypothetical protein